MGKKAFLSIKRSRGEIVQKQAEKALGTGIKLLNYNLKK